MVVIMEVCVDTVESAINAAKGGAARLELCSALSEGGLTPTPGFLEVVKAAVSIPVFVMLRPRGGDFVYSEREVEIMRKDAAALKDYGADGYVFGALDKYGNVDEIVCGQLLEAVSPLPATFHRAFDVVSNPMKALEIIIRLGFKRILTSGQELSADKGVKTIKELITNSRNRITIMPGAGLTEHNIANILRTTSATEFHASARCKELPSHNSKRQMDDFTILICNEELVRKMINIANGKYVVTTLV